MMDLEFEWDSAKNKENIRKHGVSFDEAQTVFLDEMPSVSSIPIIRRTRIASSCLA